VGIIAVVLTTVVLLVFYLPKQQSQTSQKRIVVALFENRTGDASLDMLGKMAADWITQGLSQSVEANIVPTSTVMHISALVSPPASGKQNNDYLTQLAKETKADIMVSGSYYLQKETLQFQAEVKNVKDGSLIYSLPVFTGSLQKPMDIIEKLSSEIIGGLAYDFHSNVRFISKPPNMDAYSEYIAGMGLYSQDAEEAIKHLIKAIKMDSLFCPPQFELAYAYMNTGEYARADSIIQIINRIRERLSPFERHYLDSQISYLNGNWDECLRNLRLAENISPGDWDINYAIGFLAVNLNKPGITVETYSKLDISDYYQSNSDYGAWRIGILAIALHLLGNYQQEFVEARNGQLYYPELLLFYADEVRALAALGQVEEIKKVIDKCNSISSRSGTAGDVIIEAASELRAHGYAQAAQEYAGKAVEWYRNRTASTDVRQYLALGLYLAGNWEEAQKVYEQLAAEYPENIDYTGYLGTLAARKGDRGIAMTISEKLKRIDRPYLYGQHTYCRARIAAQLGEREQAVELLQEAFAQGKAFDLNIHRDIDFEPLHDYQPFRELIKPKE
jgi:tetratricopeptide (TPR) repeat protein